MSKGNLCLESFFKAADSLRKRRSVRSSCLRVSWETSPSGGRSLSFFRKPSASLAKASMRRRASRYFEDNTFKPLRTRTMRSKSSWEMISTVTSELSEPFAPDGSLSSTRPKNFSTSPG